MITDIDSYYRKPGLECSRVQFAVRKLEILEKIIRVGRVCAEASLEARCGGPR